MPQQAIGELMQPMVRYQAELEAGLIKPDRAQHQVVAHLNAVYLALQQRGSRPQSWWAGLRDRLHGKAADRPRGLYIWGGVGRGKTRLMDMFHDCLPEPRKRRTHFYRFMQQVHQSLAQLQGKSDPLQQVADAIAQQTDILCFDEFFVTDIGDAMILAGLLRPLFQAGVVLVTTSNVAPQHLYQHGLQRERFVPAITLLQQYTTVLELAAGTDYRLEHLRNSGLYLFPLSDTVEQRLTSSFRDLAPDQLTIRQDLPVSILQREIRSRFCAEDVVWFEFAELCQGPRSAFDYIEIAKLFHALILSGVPRLDDCYAEATRRFISLIDELYDRRVKLILAAAVPLAELYVGRQLQAEFARTRSRLAEMQSSEYLRSSHRLL